MSSAPDSKSRRVARVEKTLKEILAQYFTGLISYFDGALVTVVRVSASPDLKRAEVFVSVFNGDAEEVFDLLEDKRPQMQHKISKELPMKSCPKLKFVLGGSIDKMIHITEVLNSEESEEV